MLCHAASALDAASAPCDHHTATACIRDNRELVQLICSFGRLGELSAVRACCMSWARERILDPSHPATACLFRTVAAPFSRSFSSAAMELAATPSLVELRIPGTSVGNEALAALGQRAGSLEVLDVSRCEAVGDAGLAWVAWGCPRLKQLDSSLVPRVTDAGVSAVAARCPQLAWLAVRHDPLVGDAACAALATGPCRTGLARLFMSHSGASTAGVCAVAAGCPELEEVSFAGCGSVDDAALAALGRGCPRLRCLDVEHADLVTDTG